LSVEGVNEYIDPEHLPEGIKLVECHHLISDDIEAIVKHWITRKAAGKVPLIFKKVHKRVRHRKQTDKQQAAGGREVSDDSDERQSGGVDPHGAAGGVPQERRPDQGPGDAPGRPSAVSGTVNKAIEDADYLTLSSLTQS
jgi:hypothetical protein